MSWYPRNPVNLRTALHYDNQGYSTCGIPVAFIQVTTEDSAVTCSHCIKERSERSPSTAAGNRRVKCTVEGCPNFMTAKGLCSLHYSRMKRNGRVDLDGVGTKKSRPRIRWGPNTHCVRENCERWAGYRGMCSSHYRQWKKSTLEI